MSVSIHPDQDDDMLGPLDSCASSARIPAWRSAAVRPRMAARNWRGADPATGQIVCLRAQGVSGIRALTRSRAPSYL